MMNLREREKKQKNIIRLCRDNRCFMQKHVPDFVTAGVQHVQVHILLQYGRRALEVTKNGGTVDIKAFLIGRIA